MVDLHTVVHFKEAHQLGHCYSLVSRVSWYLVKEDVMDVHQQFAFQLKFFTILKVVIFKLLLLVGLGWPTDLRVTILCD